MKWRFLFLLLNLVGFWLFPILFLWVKLMKCRVWNSIFENFFFYHHSDWGFQKKYVCVCVCGFHSTTKFVFIFVLVVVGIKFYICNGKEAHSIHHWVCRLLLLLLVSIAMSECVRVCQDLFVCLLNRTRNLSNVNSTLFLQVEKWKKCELKFFKEKFNCKKQNIHIQIGLWLYWWAIVWNTVKKNRDYYFDYLEK